MQNEGINYTRHFRKATLSFPAFRLFPLNMTRFNNEMRVKMEMIIAMYLFMISSTYSSFQSEILMDKQSCFLYTPTHCTQWPHSLSLVQIFLFSIFFTPCIFKATSMLHINLDNPLIEDNACEVYLRYSL